MDFLEATQYFDGGIIFVSYIISVIGAQTTLELLTRRTHIHGLYNWFLLASASFTMGAVGIWSMHFIGNNSMTLWADDASYQLSYEAGYTFASLVVAIVCMFISFAFVGVTEKAQLIRIIPSGIFTGCGIACMHYLGQFAVEYFVIGYKRAYVIGAIIIACIAVTIALYIFFKLRENWTDTWYKRLGCAMLMAVAVCGMHYTALVGTIFYVPYGHIPPPQPKLRPAALIGIIAAIVVVACATLFYISFKTGLKEFKKVTSKRLILDSVIFDKSGRILVKVDGTLPAKEIVHDLDANEATQHFNSGHPLFILLFEAIIQRVSIQTPFLDNRRHSGVSDTSQPLFDSIKNQFLDAVQDLQQELHFMYPSDLGIMSDIVVTTDTIAKSAFSKVNPFAQKGSKPRQSFQYGNQPLAEIIDETVVDLNVKGKRMSRLVNLMSINKQSEDEELGGNPGRNKRLSSSTALASVDTLRLSVEDSDGEDKHIFLTQRLNNKEAQRLLSQGYRFAEPTFIAKTMAAKLRVPPEYMRQCFLDMDQLINSTYTLTRTPSETKNAVCMGTFVLIEENGLSILVDKVKRYAFPFVDLMLDNEGELDRQELDYINTTLQGRTLLEISQSPKDSWPSPRLAKALEHAANQLFDISAYSKALYQSAVLYSTVIDLPAFALTPCPCQLILFTTLVTTPGTETAINRTFYEPFKCIPLSIFKPLCGYLTDQAGYIYQLENRPRPYSMQQQLYLQAGLSEHTQSSDQVEEIIEPSNRNNFSLPPPPRSKRKRLSTTVVSSQTPLSVLKTPLTVLPTKDRFWWIDLIVENIIHNSI
ncbi:hypothetical protein CU097_011343 [Rhizopus azygosporus]|uniref:MHYT domain-containing protein n=1 Tax=Rhizopus azygosporus TaxID=86630 RepID=A0A367JPZ1_RHIAZ|nr:hypothetical protein CU097_011343 [Rhizopus azygosporus]